jgi:ribosomal protein S14
MNNFEQVVETSKLFLSRKYLPVSMLKNFCVITGRVRYTIKLTMFSRHMFYAKNSEGLLTGFFMSSW